MWELKLLSSYSIFLNVICHGVKMGLHFSDPWDKPKAMLKADEPCPYKTGEKSLKAILSWTSCGLSSKVGLIVSIFPKVCSILWAPWSMDFFHKWSSCWSLRVKIEDDPPWPLWCLGLTSEWCQDGYSSDFPLCEPKSRCKTFLSLSYRCHSIQGLKPDPFSYRWRFFSSPEIKR